MADPITIPEIPGGWCASLDRLTTFIELVNLNFDIIADTWLTEFSEELKLPGVPPITLWAPGVHVPPVPGWHRPFRTAAPPEERAWVGNRFPIGLGGLAVDGKYEFPGFGGITVDPRKVTIPGRDPMTIVMEFVRVNYEILTKKMEERDLAPVLNWTLTTYSCEFPPTNDINQNNQNIVNKIPGSNPDGPPIPDSEIPTFGDDSGGGNSCWSGSNGSFGEANPGEFVFNHNGTPGDTAEVTLDCDIDSCAFVVEEAGNVRAGADLIREFASKGHPGFWNSTTTLTLYVYDSTCTTIRTTESSELGAGEGAQACNATYAGTSPACFFTNPTNVNPGERVVIGITMFQDGACTMDQFYVTSPWISFATGTAVGNPAPVLC